MSDAREPPMEYRVQPLDMDDPRPLSQQIRALLRAAILTGAYQPGQQLPSQPELSRQFGVARETVKTALRLLLDEGLIVARQGRGTFVRQPEPPLEPSGLILSAFEQPQVTVDFFGYNCVTLKAAIALIADHALTPERVFIRLMFPGGPRAASNYAQVVTEVREALGKLVADGFVTTATVRPKIVDAPTLAVFYILNRTDTLFGFVPIHRGRNLGEPQVLTAFSEGVPVEELQRTFDMLWRHRARALS